MSCLHFFFTAFCLSSVLSLCSCNTSVTGDVESTTVDDRTIIALINKRVSTGFYNSKSGRDAVFYNIDAQKAAEIVQLSRKTIEHLFSRLGLEFNYSIRFFIVEGVMQEDEEDLLDAIFHQRLDSIVMPVFVRDSSREALSILVRRINRESGDYCVRRSIDCHFLDPRYRPNFKITYDSYENMFFSYGVTMVGGHGFRRYLCHMANGDIEYTNRRIVIRDAMGALSFEGSRLLSMDDFYEITGDMSCASYLFWGSAYDVYGSDLFKDIMTELKQKNKSKLSDVKAAYLKVTGRRMEDDLIPLIYKENVSSDFPL